MAKDKEKKVKQREDNVVLTDEDPQRLKKEAADQPDEAVGADTQTDTADDADQPATAGELDEVKAQLMRITADFENFKRRTQEERGEVFETARAELALQFIPVIDNFDRAAQHVPKEIADSDWYQGFVGIQKQFDQVLDSLGIARIESVGQPFDPNRHEAVSHEPSDEYEKDVISEEFEAGYALGDSVIRPSKVKVSSGKSGATDNGKENQ